MNPQVFGKEHLIYVIVCLSVGIATCVLAKKFVKTEKAKCKIKQMFLLEQKNSFDEKIRKKIVPDFFCCFFWGLCFVSWRWLWSCFAKKIF